MGRHKRGQERTKAIQIKQNKYNFNGSDTSAETQLDNGSGPIGCRPSWIIGVSGPNPGRLAPASLVEGCGHSGWWAAGVGIGHGGHLRHVLGTLLTLPSLPIAKNPGHQHPWPHGLGRQT